SRLTATLAVLGGVALLAFVVPLPKRVYAPLEVQPREAQSVYVEVPGVLEEVFVRPGDKVEAGQPLARLANIDVRIDVDRLVGRRDETRTVIATLEKERFNDPLAAARLTLAQQSLAAFERLLEKRAEDIDRLTLRAPAAGIVLPPPE